MQQGDALFDHDQDSRRLESFSVESFSVDKLNMISKHVTTFTCQARPPS